MIPLYTTEQFNQCKSREKLPLKCKQCNSIFYKNKNLIQSCLRNNGQGTGDFCSDNCQRKSTRKKLLLICAHCSTEFYRSPSQIKKSTNNFCSQSCGAKYNNTHKTTGNRRSKLEVQIEQQLINLYPNLEINFNRKDAISSELDIYIPSLKLAVELNGIYHFEAIHGYDKLKSIQNNDNNKFIKCHQFGINLCIIDTSHQKYFKESTSFKFLNIITNLIDQHLACV